MTAPCKTCQRDNDDATHTALEAFGHLNHPYVPERSAIGMILDEVEAELEFAVERFAPYNSAHEGYAVILEELDELWDEIKNNKAPGHEARQRKEALQVATTAVRFILDLRP